MAKHPPNAECPCHSGLKYKKCCRPYHAGKNPPQPIDLMRARYSAYALGDVDFIIKTTHPDNSLYNPNEKKWRARINFFMLMTAFSELTVMAAEGNTVTFEAVLVNANKTVTVRETSTFEQINGIWYYLAAKVPDDNTKDDE